MKTILRERTVKFNFKDVKERRFYLERMAAQVNNDLLDKCLKPMDRSRYFNILISATKLIHEMHQDSTLDDIDKRLQELEDEYTKHKAKK